MQSLPLHPGLAHLPLGLAFAAPLLALVIALMTRRERWPRQVWALLLLVQLVLAVAALVSLFTGEAEERLISACVDRAALEQHESWANYLVWSSFIAAAATIGVMVASRRRRQAALLTLAFSVVPMTLAILTGQAGGELVYKHGAAVNDCRKR